MRLVQTLVVRDEADIVGEQIAYHLNAGVDFVIASDHESEDGTTEILQGYVRDGHLRLIRVQGEMRDGPWRTHMARLAATEHDADWVINTDADEFWMPRGGSLKDVFRAVPDSVGAIYALSKHFAPRPEHDGSPFYERMTVHASPAVAINDPTSPFRPHLKVAHRGDPDVSISFGSHTASSPHWAALHHWHPADVLHFPYRSLAQWENKGSRRARGDKPLGQYVTALRAKESGRSASQYAQLVVDDLALERGIADGSLTMDVRLRDALRAVGAGTAPMQPTPSLNASVLLAGEAVRDADIVRLHRFLDVLSARLATLEKPERPSMVG
jgi:Glycosyl transferase family 2